MDLEQGHIPTRQEIVETIAEFLASRTANPQEMGEVIVEHLYEIKPFPFNSGKEVIRLKREKGIGGGETVKAKNAFFNWKQLLTSGIDSILVVAGAISIKVPLLIPFAGLLALSKLKAHFHIQIDERHSVVLWAMWTNRDHVDRIKRKDVLGLVNNTLAEYNRNPINEKELSTILYELEMLGCVRNIYRDYWLLCETVKIS